MNLSPYKALVREPWFRVLIVVASVSVILSVGLVGVYPWAFLGMLIAAITISGLSAKLYFFFVYGDLRAALITGLATGLTLLATIGVATLSYWRHLSALASFPV